MLRQVHHTSHSLIPARYSLGKIVSDVGVMPKPKQPLLLVLPAEVQLVCEVLL